MVRSWIGAGLAAGSLCGWLAAGACAPATSGIVVDTKVSPTTATQGDNGAPRRSSFTGSRGGDERTVAGVTLCWCPPGKFRMGSPPGEPERRPDEAQVDVTLTRGFWMGKYEVTQGQWKRV